MIRIFAPMLVVGLLLAGCATQIESRVDGFASPAFSKAQTHIIWPADDQKDDLAYLEVSNQLASVMTASGFRLAAPDVKPDVAVLVRFGIGEPQTTTRTVSLPMYGQTGVSSTTTNATVMPFGNGASVNATTTYNPTYGVVGYQNIQQSDTTYARWLDITGFDVAEYERSKEMKPLWKIQVRSVGSMGDLRHIVPYMLTAAQPYIGTSTGRSVTVNLVNGDERVEALRSGPAAVEASSR